MNKVDAYDVPPRLSTTLTMAWGEPELPTYTQAVDDAPPSYDSIFSQVKDEYEKSTIMEFARKLPDILFCGLFSIIFLIVMLGPSTTSIVIAGIYWNDCSTNHLKIYLLVSGIIGIVDSVTKIYDKYLVKEEEKGKNKKSDTLNLFLLIWLIVGSVWVYKYNVGDNYANCNRTLYLYTYWNMTAIWIFIVSYPLLFVLVWSMIKTSV